MSASQNPHRHDRQSGQTDRPQLSHEAQLVIFPSRWQNVVSAALKSLAVAVFVWLAWVSYRQNWTFAVLCGIASLLLVLNCVIQLRQTFALRPALVLTPEAIVDHRSGRSTPWSAIDEVKLVEETLNQIVQYKLVLDVRSADGDLTPQIVPVDLLDKEPEEVFRLVQDHIGQQRRAA